MRKYDSSYEKDDGATEGDLRGELRVLLVAVLAAIANRHATRALSMKTTRRNHMGAA